MSTHSIRFYKKTVTDFVLVGVYAVIRSNMVYSRPPVKFIQSFILWIGECSFDPETSYLRLSKICTSCSSMRRGSYAWSHQIYYDVASNVSSVCLGHNNAVRRHYKRASIAPYMSVYQVNSFLISP